MAIYLKKFSTHAEYDTYIASEDKVLPNVSLCEDAKDVHYNPWVEETRIVAKFNVTSTSNATQLMNNYSITTSQFSAIEIDGVELPSVVSAYTFSTTGEHTVKYTLTDPTTIGSSTFQGCSGMTICKIPNSVTTIGAGAFTGCYGLTSIDIPDSVTSIGYGVFQYCSGLTSINIPNSVTTIGEGVFIGCYGLTSVDINTNAITNGLFSGITSIQTVTIGDSVTSIGDSAFRNCSGLTSCTIGSGVTSIGTYIFYDCASLSNITSHIMSAPSVGGGTFANVSNGGTLYVPIGSSGYETWMNNQGNLGMYSWTKVEQ